ncbi:MAG: 23S rRNA (pseudouridine(1915)-N(3))-methyltransferase RlmH [Xanthomonadaceae bacterium]|nr:23S rRNA (pseudouridine(1915)-N(3))-methyltransferase RlmH [Xanthomonadaceae bacterium]
MKITLIVFGKLKTPGLREACDVYNKKLSHYCEFQEVELKPTEVTEKSQAASLKIKTDEAKRLEEKIAKVCSPRAKIVLLDERGKSLPSEGWAKKIESYQDSSVPELVFCIGGSLGFLDELRTKADWCVNLGPQTTSHELARVILSEQLYRAMSILSGHPYHNI